jgi:hypothetical protein
MMPQATVSPRRDSRAPRASSPHRLAVFHGRAPAGDLRRRHGEHPEQQGARFFLGLGVGLGLVLPLFWLPLSLWLAGVIG